MASRYGDSSVYNDNEGTPGSRNASTMRLLTHIDESPFEEYVQHSSQPRKSVPVDSRPEQNSRSRLSVPRKQPKERDAIKDLLEEAQTSLSQNKKDLKNPNLTNNSREAAEEIPPMPATFVPYHPSSPPSRAVSIVDAAPNLPPPSDAPPFYYDRPESRTSHSPSRSWSPTRTSLDYTVPPSYNAPYEPADINGSPRPGSPSSKYGGSSKRPLPPAPLFAGVRPNSSDGDKDLSDMTAIPIDGDDDPFTDDERPDLLKTDSFMSESSFNEDDYDEKGNYEPAPNGKQERRGARPAVMSRKEVKLINGELILECKIPTILYSFLPRRDDIEFTHMRYTAVTCDPNEFVERGYKLRQQIGNTTRETELLICVTMYNENELDFTRTMHGVMRNVAHFCSRQKSRTWGKDGWKKIVICIIADGRKKVHPRTLDALAAMGVYQDGIAKNSVNQREVTGHVYEYTTQVSLDPDLKFKGAEKGIVPCQMIFCMKEKNAKKLNSHRWFFNAFGQALKPNVCILLDVGTRPGDTSLYHLWKAFDNDSNVAGAAGEIKAGKGKNWLGLFNPLVASQNFEYKMSNILDKPLESVFGYITVLPGALSAYRFHALQNDETGHGPLSQYFKGETLHGQDADVFTANMYLAEDRILCWELVAKRNESWVLKYVRQATGETDVPDAVPEFISQRRRWLNGAFFAAVYSLLHFKQIWSTSHSPIRKALLHVEFVYQFIQLTFTWFSLGNFYLTFYFVAGSLSDPKIDPTGSKVNLCKYVFTILRYACVLTIAMNFILSMGNRPQGSKKMFLGSMVIYGVVMAYTTFASIWIVVKEFEAGTMELGNNLFTNFIVSTLSTIGLYFLMSFLYLDPWHMFTSSAQYFGMLPSYICTLQIFAFCNAHDISWGTKGDNTVSTDLGAAKASKGGTVELEMPSEQLDIDSGYDTALRNLRDRIEVVEPPPSAAQQQEDYYRGVRTYMVTIWMSTNAILAMAVSGAYGETGISNNVYLKFILWAVAILALFRAIGSSTFLFINGIHSIMEGKLKFSDRSSTGSKTTSRRRYGWRSKLPSFSFLDGSGTWISDRAGDATAGIKRVFRK